MNSKASPAPDVISALQAALAAENAASYRYGVAGAHLAGAQRAAARRGWAAHQAARDSLSTLLLARGGKPVPAAAAYQLPFRVRTPRAAAALAAYLEDRVTSAYLGLVALRDPRLRTLGALGVRSAALRAAAWRGRTLAFPGLDVPPPRVPGSRPPTAKGARSPSATP